MPHVPAPRSSGVGARARTESTHIAAAMNLAGAISVRNSTAAPSRTQLMIRESGATVRPLKVTLVLLVVCVLRIVAKSDVVLRWIV